MLLIGCHKIKNEDEEHTRNSTCGQYKKQIEENKIKMVWSHIKKEKQLVGKRIIAMNVPNKRKRGKPKRRFMDAIKEDIKIARVNEEDVIDRENGRK